MMCFSWKFDVNWLNLWVLIWADIHFKKTKSLLFPHIIRIYDGKADCADVAQRFPQYSKSKTITICH